MRSCFPNTTLKKKREKKIEMIGAIYIKSTEMNIKRINKAEIFNFWEKHYAASQISWNK